MLIELPSNDLVMPLYVLVCRRRGTFIELKETTRDRADYQAAIMKQAGWDVSIRRYRTND